MEILQNKENQEVLVSFDGSTSQLILQDLAKFIVDSNVESLISKIEESLISGENLNLKKMELTFLVDPDLVDSLDFSRQSFPIQLTVFLDEAISLKLQSNEFSEILVKSKEIVLDSIESNIKLLKLELLKKNNIIGNYKIKWDALKEHIDSSSRSDAEFEKLLNHELKIVDTDVTPSKAMYYMAKTSKLSLRSLEKFIVSDFFEQDYSSLIDQNQDLIFEKNADFSLFLSKEEISFHSKKEIISRRLDAFYPNKNVYLIDNFKEYLDSNIDVSSVLEKIEFDSLVVKDSDEYVSLFIDDVPFLKKESIIDLLLEKNKINQNTIENLILNEKVSEKINEYIVSNEAFIIIDPMQVLKVNNKAIISAETKAVIENRYLNIFTNEKRISFAVMFQNIVERSSLSDVSDSQYSQFPEFFDFFYKNSGSISKVTNDAIMKKYNLVDCEFGSDLLPLVSKEKLDKIQLILLKNHKIPEDLFIYLHENNFLELDFKLENILTNSYCPESILSRYISQSFYFQYLIKNLNLTESNLDDLYKIQKKQDAINLNHIRQIGDHTNVSLKLKKLIKSGYVEFLDNLLKTEDSNYLYEMFGKLVSYPLEWTELFEISNAEKFDSMDAIIKNKSSNKETLVEYAEFFSPIYQNSVVAKLILNHPECTLQYFTEILLHSKANVVINNLDHRLMTPSFLVNLLLDKYHKSIDACGNIHSKNWLDFTLDEVSKNIFLKKESEVGDFVKQVQADFAKNFKNLTNNDFLAYLQTILTKSENKIYGGFVPFKL